MTDNSDLKGAIDRWQIDKNNLRTSTDHLIDLLVEYLEDHTFTELADLTGIKRSNIYYMIYGKSGKGGKEDHESAT